MKTRHVIGTPVLITTAEFAADLGVSTALVQKWVGAGKLTPAIDMPRMHLFDSRDLSKFRERRKVGRPRKVIHG